MAYSGAGRAVPRMMAANTYPISQNATSPGTARRFRLIADCPSPSAHGRSDVRARRLTCVIGMTMPHRRPRGITRPCSPPQGTNRTGDAAGVPGPAGWPRQPLPAIAEVHVLTRWYRTGVIYSVDVGLFQDSNDDGVG